MSFHLNPIIPAKAGTQAEVGVSLRMFAAASAWVPAFAGMIGEEGRHP